MSLADLFRNTCSAYPDHTALHCEDRTWTYRELEAGTHDLAAGLAAHGVGQGDRIAFLLPNSPELVMVDLACFRLGAVAVPLNPALKGGELAYMLQHSGSRICIADAALYPTLQAVRGELAEIEAYFIVGSPVPSGAESFAVLAASNRVAPAWPTIPDEAPAAILYTSGSTARPKGAVHSHRSLSAAARNYARAVAMTDSDVVLGMLSMGHVFGFTLQLLAPLGVGGTVVISADLAPEWLLELISRHRVTHLYGLPVRFDALSRHPAAATADSGSLRYCLVGGDSVTPVLSERMQSVLGVPLYEGCGMTEVLPYTLNRPPSENRLGSIGKPSVGMEVRLADEAGRDVPPGEPGEMLVRSEALMLGYWNDPEATANLMLDGWFRTGDVGRRDEDGYYWFVGRSKEIIKRAGSKISPLEVEDVLSRHPAVHDVAVVGRPDADLGERVVACVVLKPGMAADAAELQRFAAERIGAYKAPEIFRFLPDLPRGPTGKVHRKTLKEWVAASTPDTVEIFRPAGR